MLVEQQRSNLKRKAAEDARVAKEEAKHKKFSLLGTMMHRNGPQQGPGAFTSGGSVAVGFGNNPFGMNAAYHPGAAGGVPRHGHSPYLPVHPQHVGYHTYPPRTGMVPPAFAAHVQGEQLVNQITAAARHQQPPVMQQPPPAPMMMTPPPPMTTSSSSSSSSSSSAAAAAAAGMPFLPGRGMGQFSQDLFDQQYGGASAASMAAAAAAAAALRAAPPAETATATVAATTKSSAAPAKRATVTTESLATPNSWPPTTEED